MSSSSDFDFLLHCINMLNHRSIGTHMFHVYYVHNYVRFNFSFFYTNTCEHVHVFLNASLHVHALCMDADTYAEREYWWGFCIGSNLQAIANNSFCISTIQLHGFFCFNAQFNRCIDHDPNQRQELIQVLVSHHKSLAGIVYKESNHPR